MTSISFQVRNAGHAGPGYLVIGPEGAVEWRAIGPTLFLHYPLDPYAEKHNYGGSGTDCELVPGGKCWVEAGSLRGERLDAWKSGDVERIENLMRENYDDLAAEVTKLREAANQDKSMTGFLTRYEITADVSQGDPNPEDENEHFSYQVTLIRPGHTMVTPFHTGKAWTREPDAADVLSTLAGDAEGYENGGNFAGWCDEYGMVVDHDDDEAYDKATRMYLRTGELTRALRGFLDAEQYQELLYETERS
jgi:hypothetical protein